MWRRLQQVYGQGQVGLAHGRANYMLRQELDQDYLDARLFGSVFARPVTVATLDQYILAQDKASRARSRTLRQEFQLLMGFLS